MNGAERFGARRYIGQLPNVYGIDNLPDRVVVDQLGHADRFPQASRFGLAPPSPPLDAEDPKVAMALGHLAEHFPDLEIYLTSIGTYFIPNRRRERPDELSRGTFCLRTIDESPPFFWYGTVLANHEPRRIRTARGSPLRQERAPAGDNPFDGWFRGLEPTPTQRCTDGPSLQPSQDPLSGTQDPLS